MVAISIEDAESSPENTQKSNEKEDEKEGEVLLPIRTSAMEESNSYEWKDITQEFFEAVKGYFYLIFFSSNY